MLALETRASSAVGVAISVTTISASVASIEIERSPTVTSGREIEARIEKGMEREGQFDLPTPGSPMKAHTGPGRSTRRRALRKLMTRISLSSASGTGRILIRSRRQGRGVPSVSLRQAEHAGIGRRM
jgi:hypothetical protein